MGSLVARVDRRVLLLALNLPFPTHAGADLRNWQNVNGLLGVGPVAVFGLRAQPSNVAPRDGIVLWRASQDPALADPDDPAALSLEWLLDPMGHPSDRLFSACAVAELDVVLNEFDPQVVIVEQLWLHRYVNYFKARGCLVVLDAHNVEAPLHREVAAASAQASPGTRWARLKLAERVERIEAAAVAAADQIWVCSEYDAGLVRDLYRPRAAVHVVPNTVDVASYQTPHRNAHRRRLARHTLVFPGMFRYPPNQAAALFLIEKVFPRLSQRLPDARLLLVGSYPTPSMIAAAQRDARIVVPGPVADMRPYFAQASVMTVPLFQGSGTRFKVLEAFAARLPVVSTAKGVEGLDVLPQTHFLPAESPEEFVEAVMWLWSDPHHARRLARSAFDLVSERYSFAVAGSRITSAIESFPPQGHRPAG